MTYREYQRALIQIDTGRRQLEREPSRARLALMAVGCLVAAAVIVWVAL